mmetsp:Transcript_91010/g.136333  ORF Transcript_91010/g.136333 Transcript_91010/m.136333 type:complete len:219 (-) Transcript_91010:855-1511(-)
MNSHRCNRELSVVSGTVRIKEMMEATMDFLKSKPPSSLKKLDKKPTKTRCFDGYVKQSFCKLRTTVILNSSAISVKNAEICLSSRSIEFSLPVLRSVVMAKVAMDLFESPISASRSSLHFETTRGCWLATAASVLMAAYRVAGFGELKKSCKTEMAGLRCCGSRPSRLQMARAASYTTNSDLCRRLASKNWYPCLATADESELTVRPSFASSVKSLAV